MKDEYDNRVKWTQLCYPAPGVVVRELTEMFHNIDLVYLLWLRQYEPRLKWLLWSLEVGQGAR